MVNDDRDYELRKTGRRIEDYCMSGRVSLSSISSPGILFALGEERRSRFSRETGFHRGTDGDPGIARESNRASCSRDLVAVLTGVG